MCIEDARIEAARESPYYIDGPLILKSGQTASRSTARDVTLRRITDIREFKLYDQPNLELGRDNDFSVGVGSVKNIRLEDVTFNRPGKIELHANAGARTRAAPGDRFEWR